MRKFLFGLFLALICSAGASAQALCQWRDTLTNSIGQVIPGATVIVLAGTVGGSAAVNTNTQPGTPLATIYADPYGLVPINQTTNPINTASGDGTFQFWATCGLYVVIQAYGPQIAGQYVYGIRIAGSSTAGTPGGINGNLQFNLSGNFGGTSGINSPDGNILNIKGPIPWIDATQYGMRTFPSFTTITVTTNGTTSVSSTGVGDFIKNDGIVIPAGGAATTQSTPSAPVLTLVGATGSSTINYECKALDSLWGMTAESPATSVTNAPLVFGLPATRIASISRTGTTVTGTTSTNMPFSSGTLHAVIANVTGGVEQFSGLQLVTVGSATSFTYTQSSQSESGTTTSGSYILFKNAFIVTAAAATAGSNQIVLTTDTTHNIQFRSSGSRPVKIYIDGIGFSIPGLPSDFADGTFGVQAVTSNTITIETAYTSPINASGSVTTGASGVSQMTATVYPLIDVACPTIAAPTVQYAIYANYGSGYAPVGFTPYGLNIFEDYGPAWSQTGLILPPAMALPAAPTGTTQNQVYVGQITNISGNTLTVTPSVPGSVTSVTAQHDNSVPFQNAIGASCKAGFSPVYLPMPTAAFGYYLFSAPVDMSNNPGSGSGACNRANILDGGPIWLNGTLSGSNMGLVEWSRPHDISGFSNINTGATSGGQSYIYGYAPTMILSPPNAFKFSGMQVGTVSEGQIGLMISGSSNTEIWDSTFFTEGQPNLTSIPLYYYNGEFGQELRNVTFSGDKRWMYPVVDAQSNSELGDPPYWPVPTIEITGAFIPKIKMTGTNYGVYRGIQFDGLYPNTHTYGYFEITDADTFQAPQGPLVSIYGSSTAVDIIKITRSVGDSVSNPIIGCTLAANGSCFSTLINLGSYSTSRTNISGGYAARMFEITAATDSAPSSNINAFSITYNGTTQVLVNTLPPAYSTFANVYPCTSNGKGLTTVITDSATNGLGVAITGSGANIVGAFCNGANWIVASAAGPGPISATTVTASGIIDGTVHTVVTTSASPSLADGYSKTIANNEEATAAAAVTYTLPAASAGLTKCVINSNNGSAPDTGVLTLQTSASGQYIIFTDGTLSASGGYVSSGGAAADNACVQGVDATHWQLFVQSGTWAKH